ncbi:hypothetical protein Tcan_03875 [Toxocara canis]|uniref:Uncharacterized protein n=1 Tax=Toxocara canis TaxID=6265 RepID=A0A0B2V5E3_TOXCA|nr:hypothetical protein Tcan_03875 [Toxocara canis]
MTRSECYLTGLKFNFLDHRRELEKDEQKHASVPSELPSHTAFSHTHICKKKSSQTPAWKRSADSCFFGTYYFVIPLEKIRLVSPSDSNWSPSSEPEDLLWQLQSLERISQHDRIYDV